MRIHSFVYTLLAGAAVVSSQARASISYWDFNVFSRGTIGTSASAYGSDFQGASAAVGSAYFSGFTVRGVAATSPTIPGGFYGGSNFTLNGGSVDHGGLYVAGDISLSSASVAHDVRGGGNLTGGTGTISGNTYIAGSNTSALSFVGALNVGQAYTAPIDLNDASSYFLTTSNYAASLSPTAGYVNEWGHLKISTGNAALTVVNISTTDYFNAWGVTVDGSGTVIVNVGGSSLTLNYKTWSYTGGASNQNTLLNLNEATTLNLNNGAKVNILAPNAATHFSSGLVEGDLIVGSLTGSGQVNWAGGFSGEHVIPAPGAAVIAIMGGMAMLRRRR